jgi:hypothetical protein
LPYKEYAVFEKPDNLQQKIWRFIDIKKYADLLNRQALYFARSDRFRDEWEGKKTSPEIILTKQYRKDWGESIHLNEQDLEKIMKLDSETDKDLLQHTFVNCWYICDQDSKAMWYVFKKDIAIQSTYLKLRESIKDSRDIFIGKVKYKDMNNDINPMDSFFRRLIRKDKKFENENELRAIVTNWVDEKGSVLKKPLDDGLLVSVDIDLLVERVIVSSSSSLSFMENTQSITEKYGLSRRVERSIIKK